MYIFRFFIAMYIIIIVCTTFLNNFFYYFTFYLYLFIFILKLDIVRKLFIFNLTYLISIFSLLPIACKHP